MKLGVDIVLKESFNETKEKVSLKSILSY